MGRVVMVHPTAGVVSEASSEAFDAVWAALGWQVVDADEPRGSAQVDDGKPVRRPGRPAKSDVDDD